MSTYSKNKNRINVKHKQNTHTLFTTLPIDQQINLFVNLLRFYIPLLNGLKMYYDTMINSDIIMIVFLIGHVHVVAVLVLLLLLLVRYD